MDVGSLEGGLAGRSPIGIEERDWAMQLSDLLCTSGVLLPHATIAGDGRTVSSPYLISIFL